MGVLLPVANVKSLLESTRRTRSGSVNVTRTATEGKTTKRSREVRNIITAAVGTMRSTMRGTIVLRTEIIKSERKTTPLPERKRTGNIIDLRSTTRGKMGGSVKERGTVIERAGSGMMCRGEKAEIGACQCVEKRGFMKKERRRWFHFISLRGTILTEC
jgi:hypothetical protein